MIDRHDPDGDHRLHRLTDLRHPCMYMLAHYMAALDEVYRLRVALAYEAQIVEAYLLYATFPKRRRLIAEQQVERMRAAVRGHAVTVYADVTTGTGKDLLVAAGAGQTLTRSEWEERNRG